MAAVFTCETTATERKALLDEYQKPNSHLKVLISVEALAKGFDVPDVGCICDARPLRKSLSTAIQMWGRGLRSSPETGKVDCHLLDFSGNIVRFFEDFSEVYFNGLDKLDDGNKLDKKIRTKEEFETKGCPKCGYSPFHKRCMSCGYERISRDVMDNVPGSMKEIFIGTGTNKKKLADNSRHLWNQLCAYAKIHSKPDSQSGRAWHLFKQITGRETEWQFSNAPHAEITTNVTNKIRQMNIAYKKAIRK
jgi:superfamily II DNA or RNA helicase